MDFPHLYYFSKGKNAGVRIKCAIFVVHYSLNDVAATFILQQMVG